MKKIVLALALIFLGASTYAVYSINTINENSTVVVTPDDKPKKDTKTEEPVKQEAQADAKQENKDCKSTEEKKACAEKKTSCSKEQKSSCCKKN